ncbi:MAG TPA: ABC transporter substrate-binding protein [Spirochaetia bacterium]|nr:ABC transporter substrate-binding protein [Spirochaetia bacterium]
MKRLLVVLMAVALVAMVASPIFAGGTAEKKTFTIGFMPGVADPFYYTMERGIRAKAKELGVNVVVGDYPDQWGPEKQVPNLQALMAKGGIDLLLIAPTSTTALVAPLKAISDKGVPIITVDTFLGDGDYSKASDFSFPLAYIGTDNTLGGKQVAEHLAKLVGEKGKVYMVSTNPDVSSVNGRVDGFKQGIAEFPNMQLVGLDYCLDNQQKAMEQTTAALQKNPDIVGVFGVNVFSAQGAAQAVKNAGLVGAVKVASWDATQTLIDALKAGDIDLVLAQLPAEIGSLGVDAGYKFLSAKTMPPKKIIPGFQFFTKDNVNSPDMQQYVYSK